jgi:RsiW-degrading membrane proteinase PrsW (M82 family)
VTAAAQTLPPPPPPARPLAITARGAPRWGVQTGLLQPGQPAFWLYVVAVAVGLLYALFVQLAELLISPAGWLLSWALLLLYIVPVLLVIRFLDSYEREPRSMMFGAFVWGFVVAVFFAGFSNDLWGVVITKLGGADFASEWSAALTAPVNEEIYKYLGLVVLFLIARAEFDDLLDGFVYGALIGLGFAVAEDLMYFIVKYGGDIPTVLYLFYLRVVLSGLYGHVTYTAISGIGFAYFVTRRGVKSFGRRLAVAVGLLLVAMAGHFFWDSPLLDSLPDLAFVLVKGLPFLIGLVLLIYLARKRENDDLAAVLANETGQAGLLDIEMQDLRSWRMRRQTSKRVGQAAGPAARRLFDQLQKEQLRLALVASSVDSEEDASLLAQRARCQSLRLQLWQIPGATSALELTPEAVDAARLAAPPPFAPSSSVAPGGAWAFATPDWNDQRRLALAPGTPLQVIEERNTWLLVRAVNGWLGWTDRRYLAPAQS